MKKMLAVGLCAALALTLAACGDSSGSEAKKEETVVGEEFAEEETDAEEALDDETEEDITEAADAETGYVTATYEGMTFSYPSDCGYEVGDGYAMITLEEGCPTMKRFLTR